MRRAAQARRVWSGTFAIGPVGKHAVARDIFQFLNGVEEVEFRETFKRPKPEEKKAEAAGTEAKAETPG